MRTDYVEEPSPFVTEWSEGLQCEVRVYSPSPADVERAAVFRRTEKYFRAKRKKREVRR